MHSRGAARRLADHLAAHEQQGLEAAIRQHDGNYTRDFLKRTTHHVCTTDRVDLRPRNMGYDLRRMTTDWVDHCIKKGGKCGSEKGSMAGMSSHCVHCICSSRR